MRKLIDIDEQTFKVLSKQAIDNGQNLKNYIEDRLRKLANVKPRQKQPEDWK